MSMQPANTTTEPSAPSMAARPLVRATAAGTALALVLTLAVYGLSRLAGDSLVVAVGSRPTAPVPAGAVVGATVVAGVLALVLALLVRRLARPRRWYVSIAAAGLLLSFVSPLDAAQDSATAVWLCVMHVAVALALVPLVVRALPSDAR